MLRSLITFVAASPYNISAKGIGLPTSTQTVGQGIANITKLAMSLVGMVAVVAIIFAGLQMAFSAGDSKRVASARDTIMYAVAGLAIAIGAYAIVTFITTYVK